MPYFNVLAEKSFAVSDLFTASFLGPVVLITLLIVVLSGAYPAIYLSAFSPSNLFNKKSSNHGWSALIFRKGLVVLQFCASLIIIVATIAFYRQLQFIQNKSLGYAPEQVLAVSTAGAKGTEEVTAFVDGLGRIPSISTVSRVQAFPGHDASGRSISKPMDPEKSIILQSCRADANTVDALSLELLAGRSLPEDGMTNDSIVQVVVNEEVVRYLEYTPEEAIGKEAPSLFYNKYTEIVGVVKNFHFESFHRPIGAYVLHNNPSEWRNYTLVKMNTSDIRSSMQDIEATFRKTVPNSAFEYTFLDDYLDRLYRSEDRTARIFLLFGGISIFIACLGLFGLTAYKAEQRKKEIGIRKVLGANVSSIVYLLSREFLVLVLIALIVAIPLAWYLLSEWMNNYAYSEGISSGPFVVAGLVSILVAMITTGLQSLRAANSNPIDAISAE